MEIAVTSLHLGPLHPVEQLLTVLLAVGPFLVLGVVILVRRRQDQAEQDSVESAVDRPDVDQTERPQRER